MREERKKELMNRFPAVPDKYMNVITNANKKGSGNFVVFLTHGDELFARCYHRYYDGRVTERQRYVLQMTAAAVTVRNMTVPGR